MNIFFPCTANFDCTSGWELLV